MSASGTVESKEDGQKVEEIQKDSSQPNTALENREAASAEDLESAASAEDLESSEKQRSKELQKRSSSTPEIKISQDDALRNRETISDLQLKDKKLKSSKLSAQNETGISISQEDEPSNADIYRSILSELLAHVPYGGSDYHRSADSVVQNILGDMLAHIPADEKKSGESIVKSVLSDLLSHLSSEVAAHKVSLDCEYLKEHLGAPLTLGLSEVVIKRPVDPIHYLAHWLFKWRWNKKQEQIREEEINALNLERQKKLAELKEKERLEAEQKAMLELRMKASEAAASTLETALSQAFELISQEEEGETAEDMEEENIPNA